ncbi:hypothetical protein MMA231_02868 [Asticcacaulis sp. MM231]|uniref:hypothetical protein n=1 Tax=Asticcacaulis sp. MM231 TaxID=3157666 RepID=UPI0032D56A1C
MPRHLRPAGLVALMIALAGASNAEPVTLKAGETTFTIDASTLRIDAARAGETPQSVMPPQHDAEAGVPPVAVDKGWRWQDTTGRTYTASTEGDALKLVVRAPPEQKLNWALPQVATGTWLIPDGEGMAFQVDDAFWRQHNQREHCLDGTAGLSFPAWSYLTSDRAVIYALGDGLRSELCLKDDHGLQARLNHSFDETPEGLEILFAVRPPDPLAPAIFYRDRLKGRGQFRTLTDKAVPDLERLYGAPQAYVWGDGRDLAFLDDLKALGIERINLSYDQNPAKNAHVVRSAYLEKAEALGYLAGPYDVFDNGQPPGEDTSPYVLWDKLSTPPAAFWIARASR